MRLCFAGGLALLLLAAAACSERLARVQSPQPAQTATQSAPTVPPAATALPALRYRPEQETELPAGVSIHAETRAVVKATDLVSIGRAADGSPVKETLYTFDVPGVSGDNAPVISRM